MDQETKNKIEELEKKVDKIYVSVEKTRKYFFWTMLATLVVFILPLLGLIFVVPSFLSNYTNTIQTLGNWVYTELVEVCRRHDLHVGPALYECAALTTWATPTIF